MKLTTLASDVTTYSITAVIDSALCIGSGGSSGSLADKPIVRNAAGQLIIPGSHLKGRLRHECEKLARALGLTVSESPNPGLMMETPDCVISQIFGNPVTASCLSVDDLICKTEPKELLSDLSVDDLICKTEPKELPSEVIRPGVTINRRRGTAEDEKLYYLETSPPNLGLRFTGQIHLIRPPDYAMPLLVTGLKHINALGGSKSAGLGWLKWELGEMNIDAAHPGWAFLRGGQP
jgi:CRISPR/Cas system CSM-associated protein Csm3 (group 7 of RAMP superfamily)